MGWVTVPFPGTKFFTATSAFVVICLYLFCLSFYRVYLSPIAKFPGPKLAAATLWYEFYYDVVLGGQYQFKIKELHKTYGPIIRITPFELHIDDPDFYDEIYVGSSVRRTDKYARSAHAFGGPRAAFGTVDHHEHRMRRAPFGPFFSKKSVTELVPIIQAKIDKLMARLRDSRHTGAPVNLVYAYAALTVDIITEYAFARCFNNLETPNFNPEWHHVIKDVSTLFHVGKQFPFVPSLVQGLPDWVTKALNPKMMIFPYTMRLMRENIEAVRSAQAEREELSDHPTIFSALLNDSGLPPEEKTTERLMDEGLSIVAAGSVTVAHNLTRITFEILTNSDVLTELCSEMAAASSRSRTPLTLIQLEQLPYLNAVATEGLRIAYGVTHRLMRVAPDEAIKYKGWAIPAGTPVGMSSLLMHDNPTIFPEPRNFVPGRWLDPADRRKNEKYLVTFSKGTRNCLGLNLAHAEILLTLYALFGPGSVGGNMKLFDTNKDDIEIAHDMFNPFPKESSRGVRVLIE